MAAPAIRGRTAPVAGGATTSPAGTEVGDCVLVYTFERAGAGVPTFTKQSGFEEIRNHAHDDGSTDGRLAVAYKIATQAGAQSYQAYTTSTGSPAWWTGCVVLTKGLFDVSAVVAPNGVTQTNNAVPNPPSATGLTAASDYLVLAIAAWHLGSGATVTPTAPTNYTNLDHVAGSATAELACSTRAISGATSEDPGTYGDDVAPNGTCSITVAIPDAPPEEGFGTSALSLGATGVGKLVAYSAAAAAALVLAVAGAGATVHGGSSAPALTLSAAGEGEAPVIDLPEGSGELALSLDVTGDGVALHYGTGAPGLTLESEGEGAIVAYGRGAPALSLDSEGEGESASHGAGTVAAALGVTGQGASDYHGHGNAALSLDVDGAGQHIAQGDGSSTMSLAINGEGRATHGGNGSTQLALDLAGNGQAPIEGQAEGSGTAALALAMLGEGHTLRSGHGATALTLSAHGYGTDGEIAELPPMTEMVGHVDEQRSSGVATADHIVGIVERG